MEEGLEAEQGFGMKGMIQKSKPSKEGQWRNKWRRGWGHNKGWERRESSKNLRQAMEE